jgi:hypothetical protein
VDIALLVNPRKSMSINKVGLAVEKMPKILIMRSTIMIISMVLPILSLSPRHPHMKVPTKAVTVLATRQ